MPAPGTKTMLANVDTSVTRARGEHPLAALGRAYRVAGWTFERAQADWRKKQRAGMSVQEIFDGLRAGQSEHVAQ